MSFFSKMQNALANWMQGRNGPDNLGFTALVAAIVFIPKIGELLC